MQPRDSPMTALYAPKCCAEEEEAEISETDSDADVPSTADRTALASLQVTRRSPLADGASIALLND